jgi:hypothetical protein
LKKPQNILAMYLKYLSWCPHYIINPLRLSRLIKIAIKDRDEALRRFQEGNYDSFLLGNIKLKGRRVIQDKLIPLNKIINKNYNQSKKIIDSYCKLVISAWKQGFSEKVHNITVNCGLSKKEEVVFLDIGEMHFDKEKVKEDILKARWKKAGCYKYRLKKPIKRYYEEEMKKIWTLRNLNKYWNSKK